jgi:hypothetical protein
VKTDPALSDAVFLSTHPGWTWDALQGAPAEIVELMRMLDRAKSK